MTGKEPTGSRSARFGALFMAVSFLAACGGGAGGALPSAQPFSASPDEKTATSLPAARSARIDAPHDTVAVHGTVTAVTTHEVTLQTKNGRSFVIVVGARTVTSGGPPHVGEFAQVVGRSSTKILGLYLAFWQTPPPSLSVTGTIAAPAVGGFMLSTASQPVRVVISSQAAVSGTLLVGENVQATGAGTLVRGMVASRIAPNLTSPSPSSSPGATPSPDPASSPGTTPTPTPSSSSKPAASPTPTPDPKASSSPTADPTATPTPKPVPTPTPTPVPVPTPTPTPAAGPTLPPQGVYNSCEIDTALTTMCEQEDAAMASDGFRWEINYIGLMANKTGPESLKAWFTFDASIGMGQVIAVSRAINDPSGNALTGTNLTSFNGDSNLATTCGATNNEQIISCIDSVAQSVPGFNFKWYVYDEPGCPNQLIGYCQGTLAGGNYNNVAAVAQYINSIDPSHQVIGTEVGDVGSQTVTNTEFSWLLSAPMPATSATGFDHYPIPEGSKFGHITDNGPLATQLATAAATYNPSESIYYVGQAFSWYQEDGAGCTSVTVCPYPTSTQMQGMRDQALYYAAQAGHPLSMVFWYYWPDITCLTNYSGCSATANRAALKSAAFAPFPTTSPSARRRLNARTQRARP